MSSALSPTFILVLVLCALLSLASDTKTAYPHAITLSIISPRPFNTYPAGSNLPIVYAITHADAALQLYGPASLSWQILRRDAGPNDFGSSSTLTYPKEGDPLSNVPQYTTEHLLAASFGDVFYYAGHVGDWSVNGSTSVEGKKTLTPGDYEFFFSWEYERPCDRPRMMVEGGFNFTIGEETEADGYDGPEDVLRETEVCALPVHRFGIESYDEEYSCGNFTRGKSQETWAYEGGNEGTCGIRFDGGVVDCLAALLGVDHRKAACKDPENESAFENTRREMDRFDLGESLPLIDEDAATEANMGPSLGAGAWAGFVVATVALGILHI